MRNRKLIDPAQKFFEQIISGVAKNEGFSVVSISALPVSASTVKKKIFRRFNENDNNVEYIYPFFINGKILRYISLYLSCLMEAFSLFRKEKNRRDIVVICDPLNIQVSKAVHLAAKICGIKAVAVVTDVPYWATEMKQHGYSRFRHWLQKKYEKLSMNEMMSYDGYVNLTKYMDSVVNPRKLPSIVVEGSVDVDVINNSMSIAKTNKIIMYAGGVYEKYGLGMLVNGFIQAKLDDVELHIYGEGSYVDTLVKICKDNSNIKYMGVALNTDLPKLEAEATLLVNPRFSNEEYTKYSFPSKTLEYMSSGTSVLSTRLKGIPEDYKPYLFWLDEESVGGMALTLKKIFSKDDEYLNNFGRKAKNFAKSKSNVLQGKKITTFVKEL